MEATTEPFIPFTRPAFGDEEVAELAATLRSGWVTSGPKTAEFERAFAVYAKRPLALAVNSCTSGLHLALAALGIGEGDEVITTPLTFCATVNVILQVGARPVLVDIGTDLNIDVQSAAAAVNSRTRAILPVHFAGLPCEMAGLWSLARERGIYVVEDAAHAVGARYRSEPIGGGESAAVVFSFYATKNLSTGEGGMIVTSSSEFHDRMRNLCLHGISRDAWERYTESGSWYYEVKDCGFKYNMSDIMAAIGLVQLRKLDRMNARREQIARFYNEAFREIDELELPPDRQDSKHAWHLYVLRLNLNRLGINRAQLIEELKLRGVGASVHFIPIPLHPYYRRTLQMGDPCERALAAYPRLVSLPLYSNMTDSEVARVIGAVRDVVGRYSTTRWVCPATVDLGP